MFENAKREKIEKMKAHLMEKTSYAKRMCEKMKRELDALTDEVSKLRFKAKDCLRKGDELGAKSECTAINIKNREIVLNRLMYTGMLKILECYSYKTQRLKFDEMTRSFSASLKEFKDIKVDFNLDQFAGEIQALDDKMSVFEDKLANITDLGAEDDVFKQLVDELKKEQELNIINGMSGVDVNNPTANNKYV